MTRYRLDKLEDLKKACDAAPPPPSSWLEHLTETFRWVRAASEEERSKEEFQTRLWEDNGVAAVGQGNISVEAAIADPAFRKWIAKRSVAPQPEDRDQRVEALEHFYSELVEKLEESCRRIPHLKIFRVLAALYPGQLTTVADRGKVNRLYRAMGGRRGAGWVERHAWILERLEEALGPVSAEPRDIAQRVCVPWRLFARHVEPEDEDSTEVAEDTPGATQLRPVPAARRRRGLTALSGYFSTLLSILDFVGDGATRDELLDHLRSLFPDHKETSLSVVISGLLGEFAVVKRDGDQYRLTERGETVLETQDPSDLADWLLTHVLGVDHALVALRDGGPREQSQLAREIQRINPGWTSAYAPNMLLRWLCALNVLERRDRQLTLTDTGREWADRIHWEPEALPPAEPDLPAADTGEGAEGRLSVELPDFATIVERIGKQGAFTDATVAKLHAGLWAHARRHFAILTGLSGAGKTLLARAYGKALSAADDSSPNLCTVAVQPGWYDPGALLGYVNPLRGESYVRTPFLEFMLRAHGEPERPFVAVFDEMNLSHPEQYMAPLLSAMETGASVILHTEGDHFDGVPASVPYPTNLALIGTVNMDETTHGLSDKVLDRAFTLEFWHVDLDTYPRWGTRGLEAEQETLVRAALSDLLGALEPARLHFGWRVVDDVLDFVALCSRGASMLSLRQALDSVVHAKIVPKLRGEDAPRFREALTACVDVLKKCELPDSLQKVQELVADVDATGSARFWR